MRQIFCYILLFLLRVSWTFAEGLYHTHSTLGQLRPELDDLSSYDPRALPFPRRSIVRQGLLVRRGPSLRELGIDESKIGNQNYPTQSKEDIEAADTKLIDKAVKDRWIKYHPSKFITRPEGEPQAAWEARKQEASQLAPNIGNLQAAAHLEAQAIRSSKARLRQQKSPSSTQSQAHGETDHTNSQSPPQRQDSGRDSINTGTSQASSSRDSSPSFAHSRGQDSTQSNSRRYRTFSHDQRGPRAFRSSSPIRPQSGHAGSNIPQYRKHTVHRGVRYPSPPPNGPHPRPMHGTHGEHEWPYTIIPKPDGWEDIKPKNARRRPSPGRTEGYENTGQRREPGRQRTSSTRYAMAGDGPRGRSDNRNDPHQESERYDVPPSRREGPGISRSASSRQGGPRTRRVSTHRNASRRVNSTRRGSSHRGRHSRDGQSRDTRRRRTQTSAGVAIERDAQGNLRQVRAKAHVDDQDAGCFGCTVMK